MRPASRLADQTGQQAGLQAALTQGSAHALELDALQIEGHLAGGDDVGQIGGVLRGGVAAHLDNRSVGVDAGFSII